MEDRDTVMEALVTARDLFALALDHPDVDDEAIDAIGRVTLARLNAEIVRRIPQVVVPPVVLNPYDEASIAAWLKQAAYG